MSKLIRSKREKKRSRKLFSFNEIKVVRGIILIAVLGLVFIALIGWTGFYSTSVVNEHVNTIYTKSLTPIIKCGDLMDRMMSIRLNVASNLDKGYNGTNVMAIEKLDTEVRQLIEEYGTHQMPAKELQNFEGFKKNYDDYLNTWNQIKSHLVMEAEVTDEEKRQMQYIGDQMQFYLEELINYNKEAADAIRQDSQTIARKNNITIAAVFSFALLVLLFISAAIANTVRRGLKELGDIFGKVSSGDFTVSIDANGRNEFGNIRRMLDKTLKDVARMLGRIKEESAKIGVSSESLASISQEMSASSQEVTESILFMANGAAEQAEDLNQAGLIVDSFGKKLNHIIESVGEVDNSVRKTDGMAQKSSQLLENLVTSSKEMNSAFNEVSGRIEQLGHSIYKIKDITDMINNIADQTNLLALNAAIEAARAGEAGRGFAVVSDEIRKLAEQSKASASEINQLVEKISAESGDAVKTTKSVIGGLEQQVGVIDNTTAYFWDMVSAISVILPRIEKVNDLIATIHTDKTEIIEKVLSVSKVAGHTSETAQQISSSSQQINAASEEVASTAQLLNELTREMQAEVNRFNI